VDGHDLGQAMIVMLQTKAQVRVTYLDMTGQWALKLKVPSSLMLLEEGLAIVPDEQGFLWIRRG
jgi:hypothetical protein